MKGQHCSWVDMQKIREALSGNGRGAQKHLERLRCVAKSTVSEWRQICDLMDAIDGKVRISELSHVQPSHFLDIAHSLRREHGPIAKWPEEAVEAAVDWIDRCEAEELTVQDLGKELIRSNCDKESPPLPEGTFDVWLADPPWQYDFAETDNRKIENQYPTMTADEICELDPLPSTPDGGAVLFLWATAPKLREAFSVMDAWGFTYKTHAVWDKVKIGMGYWFRGRHELLLVGTQGDFSPPPAESRQPSVFAAERGEHSAKPECAYEMIESMFPNASRVEFFARKAREGWTPWGNQLCS